MLKFFLIILILIIVFFTLNKFIINDDYISNENFRNHRRLQMKNLYNILKKDDNILLTNSTTKIETITLIPKITKIINIYQEKYNSNQKCPGLGDYLRGCYFIMQFCEKYKLEYEFIIIHPISKYLKNKYEVKEFILKEAFKNIKINNVDSNYNLDLDKIKSNNYYIDYEYNEDEIFINNFINYLNKQEANNNILYLLSNAFPIRKIKIEETNIIKNILEPSNEMTNYINQNLEKIRLKKKDYIIIHIRTGDDYLIQNKIISYEIISKIEREIDIIINENKTNILLLTDNNKLKNIIKSKKSYAEPIIIKTLDTIISHIGENQILDDKKIKDSLLDFYLMANSNKIYSLSFYAHGSGFSKWCAITYNIHYSCKYIPI